MGSFSSYTTKNNTIFNAKTSYTIDMFMNMFACLSTSQTNEHWPLIGRTNEHDLTNTVRLFIGHPVREEVYLQVGTGERGKVVACWEEEG